MVSLKTIFKRYKCFFFFISLFVLGGATQSFAGIVYEDDPLCPKWSIACLVGTTRCCLNGEKACCEDDGTKYDTTCFLPKISRQYKYTADLSGCGYSRSMRICCGEGQGWSEWDGLCPYYKDCDESKKPDTFKECRTGKQHRSVTCNRKTGEWEVENTWSECDCTNPEYEFVTVLGGGKCCQRKDGTGIRCANVTDTLHRWVTLGNNCRDKSGCPSKDLNPLPECNDKNENHYEYRWVDNKECMAGCDGQFCNRNGTGSCYEYVCQ